MIICAVTAIPDSTKGERLIVLHKPMQKAVREIMDKLQAGRTAKSVDPEFRELS